MSKTVSCKTLLHRPAESLPGGTEHVLSAEQCKLHVQKLKTLTCQLAQSTFAVYASSSSA